MSEVWIPIFVFGTLAVIGGVIAVYTGYWRWRGVRIVKDKYGEPYFLVGITDHGYTVQACRNRWDGAFGCGSNGLTDWSKFPELAEEKKIRDEAQAEIDKEASL